MANAQQHIALLVLFFAIPDTHVVMALESTLTSCSSENTACTYQHELMCPQHSTVSVQGGNQRFDFGFGHCISQGLRCSHGCCVGCTVAMTSEETSSLRQNCDGRQNCIVSVNRTFVTCGVVKNESFYSHKSTVEYQCVQAPSHPSTTEVLQAASRFTESNETITETQTSPNDVKEEIMTSSSDETAVPDKVPWTPETWSVPTGTTDQGQGRATGEREKGSHSSQSAAATNMAPVVGGATAGAVTLVALSVALIVCWCRRRVLAGERKIPDGTSNPGCDLSMENLGHPSRTRSLPEGDATYENSRGAGRNITTSNNYEVPAHVQTSENTYQSLSENSRGAGRNVTTSNDYEVPVPALTSEHTYQSLSENSREARGNVRTSNDYEVPDSVLASEHAYQSLSAQGNTL